jgi:hypothetical protein
MRLTPQFNLDTPDEVSYRTDNESTDNFSADDKHAAPRPTSIGYLMPLLQQQT